MAEDSALTRFANSEIHQNVAETNVSINLRVVIGKRVGVASSGRTDAEGLRRLADQARAIAGVVEELDDWGGLPGATEVRAVPAAYSAATAGASPEFRAEAVRAVIAAADDAGVTAYGSFATGLEIDGGRQLGRGAGGRDADVLAAHHRVDGTRWRERLRGGGRGRRLDHRRSGARSRGGRQGACHGIRGVGRARRLPGRPRGVRRRRPRGHARLPRLLGARRPGGAQLRRARQADRQRPRDDRRRWLRPRRPAVAVRLRGRRQAAGLAPRGRRLPRRRVRRADGGARWRGVDRARPAGPEPVGPVPAQHGHVGRVGVARRADRRARPRPAGDPVPLHEPGPPQARDRHRA